MTNEAINPLEQAMQIWQEKFKQVMAQREEILTTFVAKYGCHPNELCQVEWRKSPTETVWYVKLKEKEIDELPEKKDS